MEELRLMAERLTQEADRYMALKATFTDTEDRQACTDKMIACLECVRIIYERIFEIQTQN
jgi:hypothetical protein